MPRTSVVYFQLREAQVPALDAIRSWRRRDIRIAVKCLDRINLLAVHGHELRRPLAAPLRDGINELRVAFGHVNYRILYFFSNHTAVLACGVVKEGEVPDSAIYTAAQYRDLYERDCESHTYRPAQEG
jgi:hypothetical protein